MTVNSILLTLSWAFPLVLGLWQLARSGRMLPIAPWAALPALIAAIAVPLDTIVDLSSLLLGMTLMFDRTGQAFLFFMALLWLVAGVFGATYLRKDERRGQFFAYYLLAMSGNMGLIVAGDMLSYYLWFAVMSFASYGLVLHTGTEFARQAGKVYIKLVVIGEVLLFAALVLIATETGTLRLDELAQTSISQGAAVLIFVSFGIKAGVVLLHVWLPLAHPAAPVPASAVLSGAMIKAGLLGWLRFLQAGEMAPDWGVFLIVVGLASAFYGAMIGIWQHDPKAVLAYSSISQMGLITVGVGSLILVPENYKEVALTGVLLYALHHGLAKGALFLGVGLIGTSRWVVAALLLPALALAGLPLTSGAIAKAALKSGVEVLPNGWPATLELLLPVAAAGTTLLMVRFLHLMWLRATNEKQAAPMLWPIWLVLLAAVAFVTALLPDAAYAASKALEPGKLWTAMWPIALGVGLALVFGLLGRRIPRLVGLTIPAGDVLPLMQRAPRWLTTTILGAVGPVKESLDESVIGAQAVLSERAERRSRRMSTWELRLRDWAVAGSLLLVLSLGFLAAVWLGG